MDFVERPDLDKMKKGGRMATLIETATNGLAVEFTYCPSGYSDGLRVRGFRLHSKQVAPGRWRAWCEPLNGATGETP